MGDLARRNGGGVDLRTYLESKAGEIAKALPRHLSAERQVTLMHQLIYRTPDLQKCAPDSILAAVIQAGSLGLDLSPSLGEAYLIPRWNSKAGVTECQFQPGYQGLAKLARQAGGINYLQARPVYHEDQFDLVYDPDLRLSHTPKIGDRGKVDYVYAVCKLATGEHLIEVMTTAEIEGIRNRSKSGQSGPWVTDWLEMAKKTVLKRLVKSLPRSTELAAAIDADNADYEFADSGPKEHHAVNHDNQSGHGSGAYADPATVKSYGEWIKSVVEEVNAKWLDKHTDSNGEMTPGVTDLLSTWQLSGHLLKWARSQSLINAPDEVRAGQRDKFAALAWDRFGDEFDTEAKAYARLKWREALKALAPSPAPREREPGDDDADADDYIQVDPAEFAS